MSVPNRIVFEATNRPPELGDWVFDAKYMLVRVDDDGWCVTNADAVAYRRIDAPANSRLLEVAAALLAARIASGHSIGALPECVSGAKELIAACEGAAQ